MELKDFVKTTMQSIIDATSELIAENNERGVYINPLVRTSDTRDIVKYYDGFIPVTNIDFDVAITKGAEKTGSGGASVDVYFAKVGTEGDVTSSNENVSRVQFSLRAALPATAGPKKNEKFDGTIAPEQTTSMPY